MRILLLCWVLFVSIHVVSGQCIVDQRVLLLQLKDDLLPNAPKSTKLVRWSQSSDCCSWDGVTCDQGRVTGLNLSSESISGGLEKSSLFGLRYLKSLDLSFNDFNHTVIPETIGDLASLTYLNLSNAGFGGQIPMAIIRLTSLVSLDLSISSFVRLSSLNLENPNLKILIRHLSKLEELHLDGLNLSAYKSDWCETVSSSLLNLRVLSLTNCDLSGPLDVSLRSLRSLSVIRLDNNNLSCPVPSFFSSFLNLTSLRLSYCGLYGTFPREIFRVSTLQVIDISNNRLLEGSFPEFPANSSLQRLMLGSTNFSGSLPISIRNLRNLSTLNLFNCQFSGTLPNSMVELSQLVSLDLSKNKFSGPVPSFQTLKSITQLVLSHNNLSGSITTVRWQGLDELVLVDLRNNLLDGNLPSSLFELPSLEKLQLSNNRFRGQLPQIRNISSPIDTLDLSSNDLEGPIPESIFGLQNLLVLSLSSNHFTGRVRLDHIQGLRNLTSLDLSYNNLSVIVSDDGPGWSSDKLRTLKLASCKLKKFPNLRNQQTLLNLDLSNNQISGEIPNWIWKIGNGTLANLNLSCNSLASVQQPYTIPRSFIVLDLHLNQITGNIPVLPPSASYIDFSSNNFASSIPNDIGKNLSIAMFFSVSNNQLTGILPRSICKASNIQVLDLSNNGLSGAIPDCITSMSQALGVLNLQRNRFNGSIPDAFDLDCSLKTLDLNRNSLQGKIPKSLANCTKLEVLNLGNNNLSDKFPCALKNISTLKVLVLRSNNFDGKIGCPESNGSWKMLQILDLAHNKFDGGISGTCLLNWTAMHDDVDNSTSEINHIRFEVLQYSKVYYQDAVTITSKGLELEFEKILTVFTSIDLSCNNLVGPIPENVGLLKALYVLNLSHNALTGHIPSSIGELRQLESLDLSHNNLSGTIPVSLARLNFLSFLNLSSNLLTGQIPRGTQFQTFSANSFMDNLGLCGFPLPIICSNMIESSPETSSLSGIEVDWQSIYSGIGFGAGAGVVVALLMLWRDGKYWLEDNVDKFLLVILPMIGFSYKPRDEWDDEDDDSNPEEDHTEIEIEENQSHGQFCVFCSKLDIMRKRAIHDKRCTCHSSPAMSDSSFSSSSSSSMR